VCRTEENPDIPQAAKTTFMIEVPHEEWNDVREVKAMHGGTGHSEIAITDLGVHNDQMLGGRAWGHLLGQYRPGPGRAGLRTACVGSLRPKQRSTGWSTDR
jgi:acyl-CoA dehydrogenase